MAIERVPLRKLGRDGPLVPAVGLGLMVMSGSYGTALSDEERFPLLDRAVELGQTFWDSADLYGDSEEVLCRWFKRTGKRDKIFLATKFGIIMKPGSFKIDSSGGYCKRACEASLKKLGISCIDLYYAHRLNPDTPIEETMRAMAELKKEGKIKSIGLSEVSSKTLRRACQIAPVAAVQMEYSPFVRDIEQSSGTDLLRTCRELGVAVVCYSPLGRGILTGTLTTRQSVSSANDYRESHFPWFSEGNLEQNVKTISQFKAIADKKECTTSQLAIAWILKQGNDMIPIPGTKKIRYLEENWSAMKIDLSDEEEAEIRTFLDGARLAGSRKPVGIMDNAFADTREEV